jgi:hypothetical protein
LPRAAPENMCTTSCANTRPSARPSSTRLGVIAAGHR